ncbi:hypothetical protein BLTE_03200 [Blastochloris tepida]|uniref:Uncharacterized protein n=1 Tax=Blastochloris tepida TaxID=2233851 RepID=A0A348FWF2_9HYPH|nr:hypothetical protein BLTE_03200 [Blastochloris tepida]
MAERAARQPVGGEHSRFERGQRVEIVEMGRPDGGWQHGRNGARDGAGEEARDVPGGRFRPMAAQRSGNEFNRLFNATWSNRGVGRAQPDSPRVKRELDLIVAKMNLKVGFCVLESVE